MALTADRRTTEHLGKDYSCEVYQATKIYAGSIVCQNSTGYAVPGSTSTALRALGRAEEQVDNSAGASGALSVLYRKGVFSFANSAAADEITIAQKDEICYIVDDQTVAKTSGVGTRSIAGKVRGMDGTQVKVEVGYLSSVDGDLVAANNLSDVANGATARATLGANLVVMDLGRLPLNASATYYVPCVVAGLVDRLTSVIEGAITGGDPTVTCSIGATPITGGALTITNAGSAAGDIDTVEPSAAKTIAITDYLKVVIAANSQSNAIYAKISARIET